VFRSGHDRVERKVSHKISEAAIRSSRSRVGNVTSLL
jgi:hypothetical protein